MLPITQLKLATLAIDLPAEQASARSSTTCTTTHNGVCVCVWVAPPDAVAL